MLVIATASSQRRRRRCELAKREINFDFSQFRTLSNLLPHIDVFLQRDDDLGGLGRELSEDEYDALNDETFTHAVRDDWEGSCDSENKIQPLDHWSSISQFVAFQTDTHL